MWTSVSNGRPFAEVCGTDRLERAPVIMTFSHRTEIDIEYIAVLAICCTSEGNIAGLKFRKSQNISEISQILEVSVSCTSVCSGRADGAGHGVRPLRRTAAGAAGLVACPGGGGLVGGSCRGALAQRLVPQVRDTPQAPRIDFVLNPGGAAACGGGWDRCGSLNPKASDA